MYRRLIERNFHFLQFAELTIISGSNNIITESTNSMMMVHGAIKSHLKQGVRDAAFEDM